MVNASCPGVSINVIVSPFSRVTLYAPICCVIPPDSVEALSECRIASSNFVLPWSTCPITVTTGGRFCISDSSIFSSSITVSSYKETIFTLQLKSSAMTATVSASILSLIVHM